MKLTGNSPFSVVTSFKSADLIPVETGTSSKGNQVKWVTRDGSFFIKECFVYDNKKWKDYLVEASASTYCKRCKGINFVEYTLCTVDGRSASLSCNFLNENEEYISFERLRKLNKRVMPAYTKYSAVDNYTFLVDAFMDLTGLDTTEYLYKMALVDYVIGNEDRHYNNFGVLYDHHTGEYKMAPLFDFGLGMFEHDTKYLTLPYQKAVKQISGKPFCNHSENVLKLLLYFDELRSDTVPDYITVGDYYFPSDKAKSLFIDRNKQLGVPVFDV